MIAVLVNMNVQQIMQNLERKVLNNEPISPGYWCESALRVNQLSGDLDNLLAAYEAQMNEIEAEYLKQDVSAAKAKVLAKAEINYKDYLEKKAFKKRIEEWIRLAKKRASIEF